MKKLFLTLILLSPFGILTGMEADDVKDGIPTLVDLSTKAVVEKLLQENELKKFLNKSDYIKKFKLISELENSLAAYIINTYPNEHWPPFFNACVKDHFTNISLGQALLLRACYNNTVPFKQHPHQFRYFTKLPKKIQVMLVVENRIELSLIQKYFYHSNIAIASVAVIAAVSSLLFSEGNEEMKSSLTNFAGLSCLCLCLGLFSIFNSVD